MEKVALSVNARKLVSELPRFFQNRGAFITELVQNACGAGATRVDILVAPDSFTIADNGCGVSDPKVLLEIAGSNWDNPVVADQDPAGLGLFSAMLEGRSATIFSSDGSRGFVLSVGREQLLKGEEIEVVPKDGLLKGTTVVIEGEFDVDKTVAEVKEQIRYYTVNPSGECMAFTLQGEPLPQRDFLAEGVHGKVWIRELTAGTVAISSGGYCLYDTKGNMNVLFHGQTLLCPLKGRLAEVPEYRLRVKGLGLTPRLPDRTAFIEDGKLAMFMEEFKAAVREGLLSGETRATADLVKAYLRDRLDIFLPEVGPFGIDYDLICLPAYPHGAADLKRALIPDKGEEWTGKEFEVIIDSSFSDLPGEGSEILAALHYLNQSGAVKVGVVHSSAAISTHPEFKARYHTLEDFSISIVEDPGNTLSFNGNSIVRAKATLRSGRLGKEWAVEGVLPESAMSHWNGIKFFWSLQSEFADYAVVRGHLYEVSPLVVDISAEDYREDPFNDEFEEYIGEPLQGALSPDKKLLDGVQDILGEIVRNGFGEYIGYDPKFSVSIKDNAIERLEVCGKTSRFIMDNGEWRQEAA